MLLYDGSNCRYHMQVNVQENHTGGGVGDKKRESMAQCVVRKDNRELWS